MRRQIFLIIFILVQTFGNGQTISGIEYFFDSDPGYGAGTPVSFEPGSSVTTSFSISTAGMSEGVHYLLIRARNIHGKWSTVSNAPVVVLDPGPGIPVTTLEYYIDNDPGFGVAQQVPITQGTQIPAMFEINTSNLTTGPHYLCVRAKDNASRWSTLSSSMFVVTESLANINRVEYFVDTDPGIGNGIPVPIAAGSNISGSFTLNQAVNGAGMHYLCIRAMDDSKRWSVVSYYPFVDLSQGLSPDIAQLEYFIDNDPGFGSAIAIPVDAGSKVGAVFTPSISGLADGMHFLCVRARDQAGKWSNLQQYIFSKLTEAISPITHMEYFINTDSGFGNGQAVEIIPSNAVVAQFSADTTNLQQGMSIFAVRVKDASGKWSILQDTTFNYTCTPRTWTGAISDDWNVAGNWQPEGVPGWNDDVLIPVSVPNMPFIRNNGLSCRKVVVTPGAAVHITPGMVLTVNGDLRLE